MKTSCVLINTLFACVCECSIGGNLSQFASLKLTLTLTDIAKGITQFVTNTFDFQLVARTSADFSPDFLSPKCATDFIYYFGILRTHTHTHTETLFITRITHHMAETHAKSLLKQKVVKSKRNQFSRRLSEKLLPLKLTRCMWVCVCVSNACQPVRKVPQVRMARVNWKLQTGNC